MMPEHSPLFTPALWEGSCFKILDETLLPWKVEYLTVNEPREAVQAVKEMKTRAFGQVLTFIYAAALVGKELRENNPKVLRERLDQLTEQFAQARPTFDFRGLSRFYSAWLRDVPAGTELGSWVVAKAVETAAQFVAARTERARRAAELLPSPCRLLTHCNISGELVAVGRACREMGKELYVTATETRPYLQGSRLTAWEVARAGIKVSVIPDCAIAQVMAIGKIDAVLVGADRCAQNGDIVNKVGTYPLALAAKAYGVPFLALVQDPGTLVSGSDVPIEERPAGELLTFRGRPVAPDGVGALYPAFDLTPASLISHLVGFDGAFTPEDFRQRFKAPPAAERSSQAEEQRLPLLYGVPKPSGYSYLAHGLKAGKIDTVLVPEMRPELRGAQVVTHELLRLGIRPTLISDNMMGTFFFRGRIERLYLFCLGFTPKGPEGICGSLLAAHLARAHRVPVELLESEGAEAVPLDSDVATFLGERVIPEGVAVRAIEKEVIPWALLTEQQAGGL
ncbi:MAG: hypothetical protein HYV04_14295 [Deltaproteobacteria bacterium]|nr:hypothetical protein [Deltaproteobacteria bacterium]